MRLKRGRPKRGPRGDKHTDIARATIRLLARKDFEAISMAELARGAGCSVGALYGRFQDKHECLSYALRAMFRSLAHRAEGALRGLGHLSPAAKAEHLVNHIVPAMTDPMAAGVIRATVKLAAVRPRAMEAFTDYRETIGNCAVALLAKNTISEGNVRIAVQVLLAAVTDSVLLKKPGPMSAGSGRMKSALTNIFLGYLGIVKSKKWAGTEAEDDEQPIDNEFFDTPPVGEQTAFDLELRAYRRPKAKHAKKADPDGVTARPDRITPAKMPKPKEKEPPPPKRRHRFI
jgi:AcrR family transcriptional regulator